MILPEVAFEKNSEVYKVLANKIRLQVLNNIKYEELPVEKLLKITKLTKSNLSQHLALLRHTHLVTSRREGRHIFYKIIDPRIIEPCVVLHNLRKSKALK